MKQNKGWLIFIGLILAVAVVPLCTFAASMESLSGQCGESATWVLDAAGTLTISGSGFMDTYSTYEHDQPWYAQREQIKTIVVEEGINKIGESAFEGCTNLESVSFPESLTTIGKYAFSDCVCLTQVDLPDAVSYIGIYAFSGCKNLYSVTLPQDLCQLSLGTFDGCSSLTNIFIPQWVEVIGNNVFRECKGLSEIIVDPNNRVYHSDGNCVIETASKELIIGCRTSVIPSDGSVTQIGDFAFSAGAEGNIVIPNGVTRIGECAFANYSDLTGNIVIPGSVTHIGQYAFANCYRLNSVILEEGVISIGQNAFDSCTNMKSITIPSTLTDIGADVFSECRGLRDIRIAENNESFCFVNDVLYDKPITRILWIAYAERIAIEEGVTIIDQGFPDTTTTVTLPNGVTTIGDWAFSACGFLTNITLPDSLTTIGVGAFRDCYSLMDIVLPDSLTTIGNSAFNRCYSLKDITIPGSVRTIGKRAFGGCYTLTSVTIEEGVTQIPTNAFQSCFQLRQLSLPNSLTEIDEYAFYSCLNLTSVIIPEGVQYIGRSAFEGCDSLTTVIIPASVTTIQISAFAVDLLWHVLYAGTEEAWSRIAIDPYAFPSSPSAIRHYNCSGSEISSQLEYPDACWQLGTQQHHCSVCQEDYRCEIQFFTHSWYENHIILKSPTCGEDGSKVAWCTRCGILADNPKTIEKTGKHTYGSWETIDGQTHRRECTTCGAEEWGVHRRNAGEMTKEATCIEEGIQAFTCYYCAHVHTETIDRKAEHSYENWIMDDKLIHKRNCTSCQQEETAAHTWDGGIAIKTPTCTENGIREYTCADCGGVKTESIDKRPHNYQTQELIQPTCIAEGRRLSVCIYCGDQQVEVLQKTTSHQSYFAGAILQYASCVSEGLRELICTECRQVVGTTSIPINPTEHKYGSWKKMDDNRHGRVCQLCQHEETADHQWTQQNILHQATCTEDGELVSTCQSCGTQNKEVIPALGHSYSSTATEPTCTEQGYTEYCCAICTDQFIDDYTEALGHTEEKVPAVAVTCAADGWTEGTKCAKCDVVLRAQEKIQAPGHNYGEWVEVIAPTVEKTGQKERVCSDCGCKELQRVAKLEPTETTPATAPTSPERAENAPTAMLIVGIATAVAVAGAGLAWTLRRKRKNVS